MKIDCLGSSSAGNCFLIDDGETKILLDAGFSINQIRKKLNFNLSDISAALITHRHNDHAKGAYDLADNCINVYAGKDTAKHINNYFVKIFRPHKAFPVGSFVCLAFPVDHYDIKKDYYQRRDQRYEKIENFAFVLYSLKTLEQLLYLTDCGNWNIPPLGNITHAIIECNYDDELINNNTNEKRVERGKISHLSVDDLEKILANTNTKRLREVFLSHMSEDNIDKEKARHRIKTTLGCRVNICNKNGGIS